MSAIKYLMQYQSVLTDPKPNSFLMSIKGRFHNYVAEFGIVEKEDSKELFCRILLQNPPKVPLFLWDKFSLDGTVNLCKRKWLTIYEPIRGKINLIADSLSEQDIREDFRRLVDTAQKIERREIVIDSIIAYEKQNMGKGIMILILVSLIAAIIIYLLVYVFPYKGMNILPPVRGAL